MRAKRVTATAVGVVSGLGLLVSTGGPASAATLKLNKPILIAGAYSTAGYDVASINDYDYGVKLAIAQINQAGGIGGQKITYVQKPVSTLNLTEDVGQFLGLVQDNPTAIIGLPAVSQMSPLQSQINKAKIPILTPTPSSQETLYGGPQGSQYVWFMPAPSSAVTGAAVQYFHKSLHLNKLGIMGTDESYGMGSGQLTQTEMSKEGLKPVAVKYHATTASDLTATILAEKSAGATGILDWDYPNPLAVLLKQAPQNGLTVPIISGASANIVVENKLVSDDEIGNLYVSQPCDPVATGNSPALTKFAKTYQSTYHATPSSEAAGSYDAVYVIKAAIEKAKSETPQKINAAMNGITVTGAQGAVCDANYHADGAHQLDHTVTISKFNTDGTDHKVQQIQTPMIPKQ